MTKKYFIGFLLLFFIFTLVSPTLAIDFKTTEETLTPADLNLQPKIDPSFLKIVPGEEQPPVIATSTVIGEEENDETRGSDGLDTKLDESLVDDMQINHKKESNEGDKAETGGDYNVTETKEENELAPVDNQSFDFSEKSKNKIEKTESAKAVNINFSQVDVGAKLFVCNLDAGCSGDMGNNHWTKEANINPENMSRWFRFWTQGNKIKSGILQISYLSFSNKGVENIIYSKGINTGESIFDFQVLKNADETLENFVLTGSRKEIALNKLEKANIQLEEQALKILFWKKTWLAIKKAALKLMSWVKSVFQKDSINLENVEDLSKKIKFEPKTFYLRVVPAANGAILGKASNEVVVYLTPTPEQSEVEIFHPAKLYEVKIKDFKPVRAPEPDVCSGAMILDTDWVGFDGAAMVNKKKGDRICPASYKGVGEQAWYEALWDFTKSGVDWVSSAYNSLKSAVVDGLAGLACGRNEECKMAISTGLDIGMVTMGVPPSLPNFDELMDQGFGYLASEIASQAGCPDVACKKIIKDKLKTVLAENKNTNPACKGEEEAHNQGIEPLCLPSGVKAHVDPLGTYRNAQVTLEVTRNFEDGSSLMGAPYRLFFDNIGYNAGPVGTTIHNIQPYNESVTISEPLQGKIFEAKSIIIPPMEKGEKMEIPIVLIPAEYWVPGHKEAMHGWSTITYGDNWVNYQYDDWWKLYYGGTLTMGAAIDGCGQSYGWDGCIISTDQITVDLPNTLNP